ncbi:MAG: DNA replication and repair protein RecF [Ignavibacteriae bacterium]|nr:DNA replication and repair protein RecF [Ignavibacteriota bacterium]
MILKRIKLIDFRNYGIQELELNRKFNFIFGNNGHGKTNILEAVSFVTFGKSFLGSPDQDCVKFEKEEFILDSVFENEIGNDYHIALNYNLSSKKKVYQLNKEKVSRFSTDVFGKFPVVFFSPHSLNITYGNPSERRRFFDILISQTSKVYLDLLKDLNRLLKQKNALLKSNATERNYPEKDFRYLLNSFNQGLAGVSVDILYRRLEFLKEFQSYFERNFRNLQKNEDSPTIKYYSEIFEGLGIEADEVLNMEKENFTEKVKGYFRLRENEEIARGLSLIGPQRDDFIFSLKKSNHFENQFELKNFASQGEHKTFVIGLKLAEFYYILDKIGSSPILLLDDLLSELDSERVFMIISHLKDFGQIILTSVDSVYNEKFREIFNGNEISYIKISNGKLSYEKS